MPSSDLLPALVKTFQQLPPYLSPAFYSESSRLFQEEFLQVLARFLLYCLENGVPEKPPAPYFSVECTPPLYTAYEPFKTLLPLWEAEGVLHPEGILRDFATAFENATLKSLLVLMGQRLTPASLSDGRGIPPDRSVLIQSASQEFQQGLTTGARAWTKHVHRSEEAFWGKVQGSTEQKNQRAFALIHSILEQRTWWNVFGHYKHDIVYEARISSGHGVRWGKSGTFLIGFIEPFWTEEDENFSTP
jgi:hypothetical protein